MNETIRKRIEGLAHEQALGKPKDFYLPGNAPVEVRRLNNPKYNSFIAGARAGYELGVAEEKQRCAELIYKKYLKHHGDPKLETLETLETMGILNPGSESDHPTQGSEHGAE